jgi:hypothetical protein
MSLWQIKVYSELEKYYGKLAPDEHNQWLKYLNSGISLMNLYTKSV